MFDHGVVTVVFEMIELKKALKWVLCVGFRSSRFRVTNSAEFPWWPFFCLTAVWWAEERSHHQYHTVITFSERSKMRTEGIEEVEILGTTEMKYTYNDGTTEVYPVIFVESREKAIEMCNEHTKIELKKDNAFDVLKTFENNFSRHRNYEIENYLENITGVLGYAIDEDCPFNGFRLINR